MVSLSEVSVVANRCMHQHGAIQVVALLVNLVFSMQFLPITASNALDHLELFAGDCSVTRAEHMDRAKQNCCLNNAVNSNGNTNLEVFLLTR